MRCGLDVSPLIGATATSTNEAFFLQRTRLPPYTSHTQKKNGRFSIADYGFSMWSRLQSNDPISPKPHAHKIHGCFQWLVVGPQGRGAAETTNTKQSAGLCPSFSPARLVSVEGDTPLDRTVEEQKKNRTQLEVKKKKKLKLAATCFSSSSGLERDRGAGGSVSDASAPGLHG